MDDDRPVGELWVDGVRVRVEQVSPDGDESGPDEVVLELAHGDECLAAWLSPAQALALANLLTHAATEAAKEVEE